MKINDIIKKIEAHKGANLKAVWERPVKTLKGVEDKITKVVSIVVRGGVDYDNIGVVQEKRENGDLPSENAGLPWGVWSLFPIHITHKDQDYVRLYPASGIPFETTVIYFQNGIEVSKDEIKALCYASEFKADEEKPLCFTVKADNILSVG